MLLKEVGEVALAPEYVFVTCTPRPLLIWYPSFPLVQLAGVASHFFEVKVYVVTPLFSPFIPKGIIMLTIKAKATIKKVKFLFMLYFLFYYLFIILNRHTK